MWHALRAELAYTRPYLMGGLGLAVGVVVLVSVIFFVVGDDGPPSHAAAGIRVMFVMMAPMIVGFIAQSFRTEERRARLLLAIPLTPLQIAGGAVLLPIILLGIGIVGAGLVFGAGYLVTGRLEAESLNMVGFIGGQLFAYLQMGLLAQEATAARSQGRQRAVIAGWASFAVVALLLAALYLGLAQQSLTWTHLILAHLIVAVIAMIATVVLYQGRTDFTR